MILVFSALCLSALAMVCLYLSWQNRSATQAWLMPTGWLFSVAAAVVWITLSGIEFGLAYGFLIVPLMAWLAVIYNLEIKRKKQRIAENINFVVPNSRTLFRHFALFLIAFPLSAIAATYATTGLISLLPWSAVNSMVFIVFAAPVLWGLAAYWVCADPNRFRPALWISLAGLAGAAIVHI
ncbi:hypothetical protein IMCC21906_00056 [Spongiibacter sp. IMCC21906]|uniref:hypothetical protein n=1 Tax=Spongiibacter sp. IMCC21906 TaxID=1620392 RepID=UPI00062DEAD6|nr:hypothetical protein [Spongiibacter sp. IMCC21906]AKH67751.1 hypothetical protein IMCC21906_00056 [Spongiibacter sp. IMCC21906]